MADPFDEAADIPAEPAQSPADLRPGGSSRYRAGQRIGRYEIVECIGAGGMGVVCRAVDPGLNRTVALKILKHDDGDLRARFLFEARSQARVDHPHVCKIYDTGEHEGVPFIVMQFIPGQSLKAASASMSVEEKVKAIREAAEGLQAAHSVGLIHRDVKPQNILVERGEQGGWVPYVTDFGLARELAAEGMTVSGEVLGTPEYMSPEQARGEIHQLDRRTDVFSLGVTLYVLLAGAPPINAASATEMIIGVICRDPEPLRRKNPSLPVDLETIVMKCLEKEPGRRYQSARELADELGRYLDGEPILARPLGIAGHLGRRIRRNRAPWILAAASAVLLAALLGLWLHARWTASRQAELAGAFGREVKEMEYIMRVAHLTPFHDTSPEQADVRARMTRIRSMMNTSGEVGTAPGLFALGLGFQQLGRTGDALEHIQRAWDQGYRESEAAIALGMALADRYEDKLGEALRAESEAERKRLGEEARQRYREPALKALRSAGGQRPELGRLIAARIAFLQEDYTRATTLCREAYRLAPWLYEALVAEAQVQLRLANLCYPVGDWPGFRGNIESALGILDRAAVIGRSDSRIYQLQAETWGVLLDTAEIHGQWARPDFDKALGQAERALRTNPRSVDAYNARANLYTIRGRLLLYEAGEDPRADYQAAIDTIEQGLKKLGPLPGARSYLGTAYYRMAEYVSWTGGDPSPMALRAIDALQAELAMKDGSPKAQADIGISYDLMASYQASHGQDPRPAWDAAIANYRLAIEKVPNQAFIMYNNMAITHVSTGRYLQNKGLDPGGSLREAIACFRKALGINPNFANAHRNLAATLRRLGEWAAWKGEDPLPWYRQSLESVNTALGINRKLVFGQLTRVYVLLRMAEWEIRNRRDPAEYLERARGDIEQYLRDTPTEAFGWAARADLERLEALRAIARKLAPAGYWQRARLHLRKALSINAGDADIHIIAVRLSLDQARHMGAGRAPAEAREGLAALDRAVSIDPLLAENREIQSFRSELGRLARR